MSRLGAPFVAAWRGTCSGLVLPTPLLLPRGRRAATPGQAERWCASTPASSGRIQAASVSPQFRYPPLGRDAITDACDPWIGRLARRHPHVGHARAGNRPRPARAHPRRAAPAQHHPRIAIQSTRDRFPRRQAALGGRSCTVLSTRSVAAERSYSRLGSHGSATRGLRCGLRSSIRTQVFQRRIDSSFPGSAIASALAYQPSAFSIQS